MQTFAPPAQATRRATPGMPASARRSKGAQHGDVNANYPWHSPVRVQPRLEIGFPGDAYELEADRIAEQVMRRREPERRPPCPCGGTCPKCTHSHGVDARVSDLRVQPLDRERRGSMHNAREPDLQGEASVGVRAVPGSFLSPGPGSPVPSAVRGRVEPVLGADLSRVRVHDDELSHRAAARIGARAFTHRNHIYLGEGERPEDLKLMAHELTHTLQQSGTPAANAVGITHAEPRIARKAKEPDGTACGGWECAVRADCDKTDARKAPSTEESDDYRMRIFLDLDVAEAEDITGAEDVGHAYVKLSESNGDSYTYGFYHNKSKTPEPFLDPEVPGCVAHPDKTHWRCVDMQVQFSLTASEYADALSKAQEWCKGSPDYHLLNRNCVTFVATVAEAAGKKLPSYRSRIGYKTFEADNPNALFASYVSESDAAAWRERIDGEFTGYYTHSGSTTSFSKFELVLNETFAVAGDYEFTRASGEKAEGTISGHVEFKVDGVSKTVRPVLYFRWSDAGGASGLGRLNIAANGDMKGTWGWDGESRGGGEWVVTKV